ncbi:MAG: tetratricopeptide repeat protein [Spirochaetota bacterium]
MNRKRYIIYFLIFLIFLPATAFTAKKEKEEDTFKKAVKYFYQKKLEMAEILLQEEIKKNPENAFAYSYLGDIFLEKKRFDGALSLYKKALDIDPNIADNYFRIGQIHYYKKEADQSIDNYKLAYKIDNKLTFSYYHIGLSYLMLKRDKENTIQYWEKFLKIAPEDVQYEKIKRAIELLKDPNFVLPPLGSDISIEEALHLGGSTLESADRKAKEQKAGHEDKKTKTKLEGIYKDDLP